MRSNTSGAFQKSKQKGSPWEMMAVDRLFSLDTRVGSPLRKHPPPFRPT